MKRASGAGSKMALPQLLLLLMVSVLWGAHSSNAIAVPTLQLKGYGEGARSAFNSAGGGTDVRMASGIQLARADEEDTSTDNSTSTTEITGDSSTATTETTGDSSTAITETTGDSSTATTETTGDGSTDGNETGGTDDSSGTTNVSGAATETTESVVTVNPADETEAEKQLDDMAVELQPMFVTYQQASWDENTDHSEEHSNAAIEAGATFSSAYYENWENVINVYEYEDFENYELKRRFELQAKPGTAALDEDDQQQLSSDVNTMTAFSLEKVCPFEDKDCNADEEGLSMDDLEIVFASTHDKEALMYYWEQWRDIAGKPTKPYFEDSVELMNKAALAPENGFNDAGEMWLQPYRAPNYGTDDFKSDIERLWEDVKGLYEKLHAYVRYRLRSSTEYNDYFGEESPIPAHILGNMWGQSWENIYELVAPFENTKLVDISDTLENNIENVTEMFQYAEGFFKSLGLYEMTDDFWSKSMFEEPEDAIAVCHASAWDFLSVNETGPIKDGDFRIKMCTDRNQEDFITIHHEMGHIEYQMAYSQVSENDPTLRPLILRDGANPGFHEAIGDTIALSVSTPSHLEGLKNDILSRTQMTTTESSSQEADSTTQAPDVDTYERDINQLMRMALEKIAFIPYAYILDKFRWDVFAGEYEADVYNYEWWKLRVSVQGLKPPDLREKDTDFDPGCKYHVASNIPYIRYFVATILQFQFHERLCEVANITANNETAVYQCDIYNNTIAGEHLKELLKLGRSKPWTEQLMDFMGSEDGNMTSAAILNYFAPLDEFLDEQIKLLDLKVGWDDDTDKYFVQHIPATVPIVVGVVLCVMIVIVVIAYFVGKNRNEKKKKGAVPPLEIRNEETTAKDNEGFEMNEKKSVSSNDS